MAASPADVLHRATVGSLAYGWIAPLLHFVAFIGFGVSFAASIRTGADISDGGVAFGLAVAAAIAARIVKRILARNLSVTRNGDAIDLTIDGESPLRSPFHVEHGLVPNPRVDVGEPTSPAMAWLRVRGADGTSLELREVLRSGEPRDATWPRAPLAKNALRVYVSSPGAPIGLTALLAVLRAADAIAT